MSNSILVYSLYIITPSIRVSNSFSFLVYSLMLSMYIRWLIIIIIIIIRLKIAFDAH